MSIHVVTGGAGFIGSHIAEALVARGDSVRVLDNFVTGTPRNVASFASRIDLRDVDVATDAGLVDHLAGVDTVFHQAALPSVPRSIQDPVRSHEANVNATLNLLVASRSAGVRRVVYASSSSIYGDSPTLPKREDMPACPLSPYGGQKYFAEVYTQVFWRTFGLETVALRYFNVFGPRQDASSPYTGVLALFIPAALEGRRPTIYGDGQQSRDFMYVANIVDANLTASTAEGVAGEVFNVASGDRITVTETLAQIKSIIGSDIEPIHADARSGDILHSQADVSKARDRLGWTPSVSFPEGLERTIDWYRSQNRER